MSCRAFLDPLPSINDPTLTPDPTQVSKKKLGRFERPRSLMLHTIHHPGRKPTPSRSHAMLSDAMPTQTTDQSVDQNTRTHARTHAPQVEHDRQGFQADGAFETGIGGRTRRRGISSSSSRREAAEQRRRRGRFGDVRRAGQRKEGGGRGSRERFFGEERCVRGGREVGRRPQQ